MKKIHILVLIHFCAWLSCYSQEESERWSWSLEEAKTHAEKFNDSTKWEMEAFQRDLEIMKDYPREDYPLTESPFPTPVYTSPGNGNGSLQTEIAGKELVGHYAIIGKGKHSEHLFTEEQDPYISYFTILTISDGSKTGNPVLATSRNHPHYLSQGSLNTTGVNRVDWIAVQLADKNAYAIINSRLFDLRVGRIILAAPQQDGSIRFYQTSAPAMNPEETKRFIDKLQHDPQVLHFFTRSGNI